MLLMASPPAMDTVTDTCPAVHQNGTAHREPPDTRPATTATAVLRLHFYHSSPGAAATAAACSSLSYPPGDYVAEELCVDAARACSEYAVVQGRSTARPHSCVPLQLGGIGPEIRLSRGHSESCQQRGKKAPACSLVSGLCLQLG